MFIKCFSAFEAITYENVIFTSKMCVLGIILSYVKYYIQNIKNKLNVLKKCIKKIVFEIYQSCVAYIFFSGSDI